MYIESKMMQKQYTVDAEMVNVISSKRSYANSLPSAHKSKTYSLWLVPAPALLLYKDIKKNNSKRQQRRIRV